MTSNESNSTSAEAAHAESRHIRGAYLAALDDAIAELPHRLATELRAGITEELVGLEGDQLRASIAALGAPADVARAAAEAGHERQASQADPPAAPLSPAPAAPAQPSPRPLAETRGYALAGVIAFGIGGIVIPFVGWLAGCVIVATSKFWRTGEKVWAIIIPPLAMFVPGLFAWAFVNSAEGDGANPLMPGTHTSIIFTPLIVAPLVAVWLLLRLRKRRTPEDASR